MNNKLYYYKCSVVRVVDGDTLICKIDNGFHSTQMERLRLLNVDTPEMVGSTRAKGIEAKTFTQSWIDMNSNFTEFPFIVHTIKTDSFGRYLAVIWNSNGDSLNDAINQYLTNK